MRVAACTVLVLLLGCLALARADDWPQPVAFTVFSESGGHFVRVIPGERGGGAPASSTTPAGRPATALVYGVQPDRSYRLLNEVALLNPISPVTVLVSDDGYFLALDNWHGFGVGKVATIYGPRGRLVRSYQLDELYRPERLLRIPRSVSSSHWRCQPVHFVEPREQKSVYVPEVLGGYFVFTLASGTVAHTPGARASCVRPDGPFSWTWIGN